MSPRSHLISVKSTKVVSNLIHAPFLEILQMSDGRMRDTKGSQDVKSHLRSTTKSPNFFRELIISGFLCFSCSLLWYCNLRNSEAIIWRSPKLWKNKWPSLSRTVSRLENAQIALKTQFSKNRYFDPFARIYHLLSTSSWFDIVIWEFWVLWNPFIQAFHSVF